MFKVSKARLGKGILVALATLLTLGGSIINVKGANEVSYDISQVFSVVFLIIAVFIFSIVMQYQDKREYLKPNEINSQADLAISFLEIIMWLLFSICSLVGCLVLYIKFF